jgi:hypothetical protein
MNSSENRRGKLWWRFTPLVAGLPGVAAFVGCATLQLVSDWATRPVTADGESTDWVITSGSTITEEGLQVTASNDSANLHLMVRFRANNDKWPRPCAMTGLVVWLNPSGKKSTDYGIRFAAGPSPEDLPRPGMMSGTGDSVEPRRGAPRPALDGQLTLIDKKADATSFLPADGSRGPSAGFVCQSGVCTYELNLPLKPAQAGSFGINAKPGSVVMVGLAAGPSKEERDKMREQRPEGGMGGPPEQSMGGGPPGGGMRRGPRGGPPGGQRPGMQQNPELWFKVKLATAGTDKTGG